MYFKIRKANDQVVFFSCGPAGCNKWHTVVDDNGVFDAIRCFALRRKPKCKNCRLAHTIQSRIRRKTSCKVVKKLKRQR